MCANLSHPSLCARSSKGWMWLWSFLGFYYFFKCPDNLGQAFLLSFGQGIDCISLPGSPHRWRELWVRDSGFFLSLPSSPLFSGGAAFFLPLLVTLLTPGPGVSVGAITWPVPSCLSFWFCNKFSLHQPGKQEYLFCWQTWVFPSLQHCCHTAKLATAVLLDRLWRGEKSSNLPGLPKPSAAKPPWGRLCKQRFWIRSRYPQITVFGALDWPKNVH